MGQKEASEEMLVFGVLLITQRIHPPVMVGTLCST